MIHENVSPKLWKLLDDADLETTNFKRKDVPQPIDAIYTVLNFVIVAWSVHGNHHTPASVLCLSHVAVTGKTHSDFIYGRLRNTRKNMKESQVR